MVPSSAKLLLINSRMYRYTAYRVLVRWCYGFVGRQIRIVIPSCAVSKIRSEFPSDIYKGLELPATGHL